ncbi:class I SAM-dependent methyltransferase [Nocardioides litoris]|uniref:class I SAM-dependent methyltransferase n=1 Tax=Nocardioides litoris TaxID=1926648 RepID=UPI001122E1DB|nr:methyltransferase domain-containing protein [Nocardioides litoris]
MTRWEDVARARHGDDYAAAYAERFRALAAEGDDVHGEADAVAALRPPPARVLDAGCGTGRVARRLAEQGYDVVGVDADASMVAVARADAPDLDWRVADLADLAGLDLGAAHDLVLAVGNVLPLVEPGTLPAVLAALAAHLGDGGLLVVSMGLDVDHLPEGCPVTPLADVEAAWTAAGLVEQARHGTWAGDPWTLDHGYLVTVLTRA